MVAIAKKKKPKKRAVRNYSVFKKRSTKGLDLLPKSEKPKFTETELVRSICKDSFFEFVKEFWPTISAEIPVWNWHIKLLCQQMQKMAERVFKRKKKKYDLVVNISPGTTKSTIMSVMFPIWCWTRMPSFRFIGASYSFPLAMDLSTKSRDIVMSEKFADIFPEIRLREDQNTKGYFKNTQGGYRYAVGVNGSVLGMHAHFIVVDDPLDPQQSLSGADIKAANYWITNTLSTRKVNKAVCPMAIVMQRLHEDDPSAYYLKQRKRGAKIKHICLPAEITDNIIPKCLERHYVKGLMDPNRLSKSVLREEKSKGELYYASQFLQDPAPPGGNMFKVNRLKRGVVPNKWAKVVRFWDKAGTKGGGAWTVGTLLGQDLLGRYWVLDVVRGQWDSYERERVIRDTAEKDGRSVVIGLEQEPGSGGKESAENTVRRLAGYKVRIIKVDTSTGGKVQRADPFSSQVNAGNVYVVKALWNLEWVNELKYFPNSKYMDQVDSVSGAFMLCAGRRVRVGGLKPRQVLSLLI